MTTSQHWPMHGGILPPPHKSESNTAPIQFAGIPAQLIISLQQRQGGAIPIVAIGQRVRKGELIATASDAMGSPLHASSSGEIIAIAMRPIAMQPIAQRDNATARCIVIRTDGLDEWIERADADSHREFETCAPALLIERIASAGVVGAGGAGFPAARKLVDDSGKIRNIDTLIINGAECEPYITADDRLMRDRAADIVRGIQVLQHIMQPQQTLLGIEDSKPEALTAMRSAVIDSGSDIDIIAIPSRYPIGSEALLIYTLTGREVSSAGIPADIGVLCFNVGTVAAIYRAVAHNEPMISRIVTITGQACATNHNVEALIGTPLRTLLEQANWQEAGCTQLLAGGPFTGFAIDNADVPVTKTSHAFIAGSAAEFPSTPAQQACIRCGFCAEACPVALLPQQLHMHARRHNAEQLQTHDLFDCIECGACDYVCPSHIPLVQTFRESKRELKIIAYEQQQALIARERFNAHQARVIRNKSERDLQRQQRLSANSAPLSANPQTTNSATPDASGATADTNKQAAILAAIARAKAKKSAPQRLAAIAALAETAPLTVRLQQRIDDIERLILSAETDERRKRLQRARDDLQSHLAEAENNPNADSGREQIEQALARTLALKAEQTE